MGINNNKVLVRSNFYGLGSIKIDLCGIFPSLRSTTDNRFVDIIGHCKTFIVGSILNGL